MKTAYIILIATAFLTVSCKRCTTCEYTYKDINNTEQTYTYPEACGSKQEIEAYEESAKAAAATFAGSAVICE